MLAKTTTVGTWAAFDEDSWNDINDTFGQRPGTYRLRLKTADLGDWQPVARLMGSDPGRDALHRDVTDGDGADLRSSRRALRRLPVQGRSREHLLEPGRASVQSPHAGRLPRSR